MLSLLARLPFKWLMVKLATILAVMSFFLVWLPFVHVTDGARWDLGVLTLAPDGLRLAALILLKAVTVFTLMVVLLASAPLQETLKAAHALHVPGPLVHLVQLAYRFVFVVADEFSRLRTALRCAPFTTAPTGIVTAQSVRSLAHSWFAATTGPNASPRPCVAGVSMVAFAPFMTFAPGGRTSLPSPLLSVPRRRSWVGII